MVKRHVCPNCGSDDCDVVKTEHSLPKGAKGSSPNAWPFPTSLVKKPLNDKTPNTNGLSNAQEAPF